MGKITRIITILLVAIFAFSCFKLPAKAIVRINGYYKKSGVYVVMPYYRTSPNSSKFDNWPTKGNYNPLTGKKGYANPYTIRYFR